MTIEQQKKMLMLDHKLDPVNDFYVHEDDERGRIILIRRSGIDKLELELKMSYTIESLQVVPYGDKISVTILGRGVVDGVVARSLVHVNPDNCVYPNYAEVADTRCRHRLILKLARLYEHSIFSQAESEKWIETRNIYMGAVTDVTKMLEVNNAKKNSKKQELSQIRDRARAASVPWAGEAV